MRWETQLVVLGTAEGQGQLVVPVWVWTSVAAFVDLRKRPANEVLKDELVEVGGDAYHAERAASDSCRDGKLGAAGYRVLRLPASLVERRLEEAVALVREALRFRLGSRLGG